MSAVANPFQTLYKSTEVKSKYRPEIDGLRAFAVVAVIINHFNKDLLPSGYLGVDIFFVISGYVITSSLAERKSKNFLDFVKGFYERRIKRLVPALVVFVLITSVLNCLFNPDPGTSLKTGITSLFGLSNLFLFKQSTDYFAQSTELNPFTHTWSLGVEEQFYLLFPFFIWFSGFGRQAQNGARNLFLWIGALTVASLTGFIYLYQTNQPAAYFLMPPRFWEMAAGCLVFIGFQKRAKIEQALEQVPPLLVLAAMVGVMLLPVSSAVPATISIVLLSAILIACLKSGTAAFGVFTNRRVVYVGLISYSLYLWHWGVLAVSRLSIGIHWWSIPFQVVIMLLLAFFSYNAVEKPLRLGEWRGGKFRILTSIFIAATTASALMFSILIKIAPGDFFYLPRLLGIAHKPRKWGKYLDCHGADDVSKIKNPFEYCLKQERNSLRSRRFYLIGDSHAAQLVFMLEKVVVNSTYEVGFINTENHKDFPHSFWSKKDAVDSSDTSKSLLEQVKSGDIVAIAFHRGHLNRVRDQHVRIGAPVKEQERQKHLLALRNFDDFIKRLESKKVNVILMRDVPMLFADNVEISTCQWQQQAFRWNQCAVTARQDDETRKAQDNLYNELIRFNSNAKAWDPRRFMNTSSGEFSFNIADGKISMWDQHHITREFSQGLAPKFKMFLRTIDPTGF